MPGRRIGIVITTALMLSVSSVGQQKQRQPTPADRASLKSFLQAKDKDKESRYIAAFRDLNGDGVLEAVVYLVGNDTCGSGGCDALILMRDKDSWRAVTEMTIVQLPIRVLASSSNGWRDLGVWVQGGGIQPGYESELKFDGKSYPENPSTPPAKRARKGAVGEIVIGSIKTAVPLY